MRQRAAFPMARRSINQHVRGTSREGNIDWVQSVPRGCRLPDLPAQEENACRMPFDFGAYCLTTLFGIRILPVRRIIRQRAVPFDRILL